MKSRLVSETKTDSFTWFVEENLSFGGANVFMWVGYFVSENYSEKKYIYPPYPKEAINKKINAIAIRKIYSNDIQNFETDYSLINEWVWCKITFQATKFGYSNIKLNVEYSYSYDIKEDYWDLEEFISDEWYNQEYLDYERT